MNSCNKTEACRLAALSTSFRLSLSFPSHILDRPNRSMAEGAQSGGGRRRLRPNVLVTGTPGTGKTTTSSLVADATGMRHFNISDLAREKGLHDGWDDELDCHVINEDLVCDEIEDQMDEGGNIVDYHGCEFFPERWFDLVVVLQTDNSILHDRLTSRGYMGAKLTNNIECEIFQVLLEEARESYAADIVMPVRSDNVEDISNNVATLTEWINNWKPPVQSS